MPGSRTNALTVAAAIALIAIGCARIAATYPVISPTIDETDHVSSGVEWWSRGGAYNYDPAHPPLARILAAFPLWLRGFKTVGLADWNAEGAAVLNSQGNLMRDLAVARSGILVLFVLACGVVFLWARSLFGPWIGLICLFEFTMIPNILGHFGLVTTDGAAAAGLPLVIFTLLRWIEAPSWRRLMIAAAGLGIAILCKSSVIPFLVACAFAWGFLNILAARRLSLPIGFDLRRAAAFLLIVFLVVWAGYHFRSEPLSSAKTVREYRDRIAPDSTWHTLVRRALDVPLPAGGLFRAIGGMVLRAEGSDTQYFMGDLGTRGWPLFFPVGLAVKTPLPFLILSFAGVLLGLALYLPRGKLALVYPGVFAAIVLLSCVPAHLNLGSRHILPVYPLFAVASGVAIQAAWNARRHALLGRIAIIAMLLWLAIDSAAAFPDYIAYFNQFAGSRPERIFAESDIDWGQDLVLLKKAVDEAGIRNLYLADFATIDPALYGFSNYTPLPHGVPVSGWVAVCIHRLGFEPEDYAWLGPYPWRMVGRSYRLYFVPAPAPQPLGEIGRNQALVRLHIR